MMFVAICILLVITALVHMLWIGVRDLFVNVSKERRADALTFAFLVSVMWCCCLGLVVAIPAFYLQLTHPAFWQTIGGH